MQKSEMPMKEYDELITKSVVTEIDSVITLLEADIPAKLESPKSKKFIGQMEHDLKGYFKQLENAMPMSKLEQIYLKYVEQE